MWLHVGLEHYVFAFSHCKLWSCMRYINSVWHLGCRQVYCIGEVIVFRAYIGWNHIQSVLISRSISGYDCLRRLRHSLQSWVWFITFVGRFHYKQCWTTSNITKNSIRDRYKPISKIEIQKPSSSLFIMKTSHKSDELNK
jgi:hypothetical protein